MRFLPVDLGVAIVVVEGCKVFTCDAVPSDAPIFFHNQGQIANDVFGKFCRPMGAQAA